MEDKNFTIIEDIFDNNDYGGNDGLNDVSMISDKSKKDYSFLRTIDSNSARPPYPMGNVPSLLYDEDMIKNKLSRQINPRSLATQYNSMNGSNRILQSPPQENIKSNIIPKTVMPVRQTQDIYSSNITCRNIYEHVENCPFCQKYYKQSNRSYILIIVFLVLIILLLLRQNYN